MTVWPELFCDSCRARPGEACVTMGGNLRSKPHANRGRRPKAADAIPAFVRGQVTRRSGGRCEAPFCTARAVHMHHIKRRSQGGADTAENIKHLCAGDHRFVHDHPDIARMHGLLAPKGDA